MSCEQECKQTWWLVTVVRVAPPATPTIARNTDDKHTISVNKRGKTGAIRSSESATSLQASAINRHCLQSASRNGLWSHANIIRAIIPKPSFSNHATVAANADAFCSKLIAISAHRITTCRAHWNDVILSTPTDNPVKLLWKKAWSAFLESKPLNMKLWEGENCHLFSILYLDEFKQSF